ncbi:MAG: pyridoxal-dependent decarboxylase [Arenimonas sp.]|nr:pyridoxal-dependent decarboxylase [Arenimonas sp.]
MTSPAIHPCFLGPYGENDTLLEKLVVEFLRDHVYWRRNFHPEDPPAIPTGAAGEPAFRDFEARMRRELHALSASLKRSVPFHSPRYIGHMVSDLLLPGLAAQFLTLPYNPNNVSIDAAPVTIDLELKVGLQLARMFGFVDDPARPDCAFGHLTSGGTLANFQALRLALALKAFPVALRAAAPPGLDLPGDDEAAFNLTPSATVALLEAWNGWLAQQTPAERRHWRRALAARRLETLGLADFLARHPTLRSPRVLAPVTAHYSWSKGMKLMGLGRAQLELVPERGMRLDPGALEDILERCQRERQPVLLCVGVLGSTEFGTIDPVDELVAARERWAAQGLGFGVHVDAAWGGYLATLFREPDGSLRKLSDMREEFQDFPAPEVHAAVGALAKVDSITVDPHKLGYIPYGAGAFLCRDQRAMALLAEDADYVFSPGEDGDFFRRFRQLGRYIPEGSKPGAAAAAVYVTHRVLPLDHENFGALPRESILATGAFRTAATRFAARLAGKLHCSVPFEPDSNLICLALNPAGNRDVATMNRFVRALHERLSYDPRQPLQAREFFGSMTTLRPEILGAEDTARVLASLDLDPATLDAGGEDDDRIVILRHTLMNPFLLDTGNGISYLEMYFEYLERTAAALVPAP